MSHEIDIFQSLLSQFGDSIRLPNLKVDNDGYCCLAFDAKVHVHMQVNRKTHNLIFFSELGTVNDCDKLHTFSELLQANTNLSGLQGCTLGYNPKTTMVTLAYQEPLRNFDFARFEGFLRFFVDSSQQWMDKIVDIKHSTYMPEGVFHADDYDTSQMLSV